MLFILRCGSSAALTRRLNGSAVLSPRLERPARQKALAGHIGATGLILTSGPDRRCRPRRHAERDRQRCLARLASHEGSNRHPACHCRLGPLARAEHAKIERVMRGLFDWFCEHPGELPPAEDGASEADRVIDYLAGMTDRFAIRAWSERFVPQGLVA